MGDNEQKALQLMADAEKKMTSSKGFFGSLFGCVFFLCKIFVKLFLRRHNDILVPPWKIQ